MSRTIERTRFMDSLRNGAEGYTRRAAGRSGVSARTPPAGPAVAACSPTA
jgi:hypothetical protein